MAQNKYDRVNLDKLSHQTRAPDDRSAGENPQVSTAGRIRLFIIPLSVLLCAFQALLTLLGSNYGKMWVTSTLIPVVGFAVLMFLVLAANPLLRLSRVIQPFSRAELMSLFASMLVTAGIATFGLTEQLVPLVSSPWNPEWNVPQARWEQQVLPHLNPKLYLTVADDAVMEEKESAAVALEMVRAELKSTALAMNGTEAGLPMAPLEEALLTLTAIVNGTYVEHGEFERAKAKVHSEQDRMSNFSIKAYASALPVIETCYRHNSDAHTIEIFRQSAEVAIPQSPASWTDWWQYYRQVFREVPWATWARPLSYWLIFIFGCYGLFYFLTFVVVGHWTQRDKLIFPLAKLPEALIDDPTGPRRWWPRTFCTIAFWSGFALSFSILSYNAMANAQLLAGLGKINLGISQAYVDAITDISWLEGLKGEGTTGLHFLVVFTVIGIAFMLPTEVSFSTWFYVWVGKLIILFATWIGLGRNGADFPADFYWHSNAITGLGMGGLTLFSAFSLLRSVKEYAQLTRHKTWTRRLQLMIPLAGLAGCITVLVSWLCWNSWPQTQTTGDRLEALILATVFVAFITLLTLGLMRVVAESGVFWIFLYGSSFFNMYKVFGLATFIKSTLVAPLLPIYTILFLDLKTFLAPNLANAEKIRQDTGGHRWRFHLNVIVCIVVTVFLSLAGAIYLGHMRGANQMEIWFYTQNPKNVVMPNTAQAATMTQTHLDTVDATWYLAGAGWVAVTLLLRRSLFWFPHPIGMALMNNSLMVYMWFSFFLGWAAKFLTIRYGGKHTFDRVRLFFIGLIMGELMAIFIWPIISVITGIDIGQITLNRYNT